MRLLLDTHVLVWALFEPGRLSAPVAAALMEAQNELFVSVASIWELGIKHQSGKLPGVSPLLDNVDEAMHQLQAQVLPIALLHARRAATWPSLRRDPFDRMLAAQADVEKLQLTTADGAMRQFPVAILW